MQTTINITAKNSKISARTEMLEIYILAAVSVLLLISVLANQNIFSSASNTIGLIAIIIGLIAVLVSIGIIYKNRSSNGVKVAGNAFKVLANSRK